MKPPLPKEFEALFPREVVGYIRRFLPHLPPNTPASPGLQKELERLQKSPKRFQTAMYLKGLEDFILK
jgi:hypothetical protein